MPLPLNDRQFAFWRPRQAISKALIIMDRKVEGTLPRMARANRTDVEEQSAGQVAPLPLWFPSCSMAERLDTER